MEEIVTRSFILTWDPGLRLAVSQNTSGETPSSDDAEKMREAISRWSGDDGRPFAILVNALGRKTADAKYRAFWGDFFKTHKEHCYIAAYNVGPIVRVAAEMFSLGTGIHLKTFATETEARAWLGRHGFAC